MSEIVDSLHTILGVLSSNNATIAPHKNLLDISVSDISTPVGNILPLLQAHKSTVSDQSVDFDRLKQLIDRLQSDKSIIRLNHIGFCYKVDSQDKEKERLVQVIRKTKHHLYQEPSNDDGLWLFVGDVVHWEEPMIELLPVEKTTDAHADYWLPHIQIDIDTTLSELEIKDQMKNIFGNDVALYAIAIDGVTYIVRYHLGTIDGINIKLDLATNARNVRFAREQLLTEL